MITNKIATSALMFALTLGGVAFTVTGCAGNRVQRSTGTYLDDKAISARVKTALFRDPDVSGFDVHVKTYRGDVQLSGFVDNAEQKERAANIARTIQGVQVVSNDIQVKPAAVGAPGSTLSGTSPTVTEPAPQNPYLNGTSAGNSVNSEATSQTPAGAATSALSNNELPAFHDNVEITAKNGRAVLRGTVRNEEEKATAERKMREIPGITWVDNELQIFNPQ